MSRKKEELVKLYGTIFGESQGSNEQACNGYVTITMTKRGKDCYTFYSSYIWVVGVSPGNSYEVVFCCKTWRFSEYSFGVFALKCLLVCNLLYIASASLVFVCCAIESFSYSGTLY